MYTPESDTLASRPTRTVTGGLGGPGAWALLEVASGPAWASRLTSGPTTWKPSASARSATPNTPRRHRIVVLPSVGRWAHSPAPPHMLSDSALSVGVVARVVNAAGDGVVCGRLLELSLA